MKRVILTGVVLILLIIITADIYNDQQRSNGKNKLQAVAAARAQSGSVGFVTPTKDLTNRNENITGHTDATQSQVARNSKRARYSRHLTPADGNLALADAPSRGSVADMDDDGDGSDIPDIGAQISKSFYGYAPNTTEPEKEQPVVAEHRSTVHFGPEISIMQNSFSNGHSQNMPQIGFRAGAIADISLSDHLALQPGLLYELKGVETENVNSTATMEVDTKDKINLNYIEMPVDLVVKFGDWRDGRFMIGTGPYIGYLVRAQDHYQTTTTTFQNPAARTTQDNPVNEQGHPGTTNGQYSLIGGGSAPGDASMRTLDWGINSFVGCEMPGGLFAKAGTEVGLMDIQHNADGSYSNRNYNFFVSFGYLIGYKK